MSSPNSIRPWRARCTASGPAAEPVAGSSSTPIPGANIRVLNSFPAPAKQLTFSGPRAATAPMSGSKRCHGLLVGQRDAHVDGAVVVGLDRQL